MNDWKQINILSLDDCLAIVQEVLKQRGMNLTPSMRATIGAAWEQESYEDYIDNNHLKFSSSSLRGKASLLYKNLSQALGVKKINKHNLKTLLQKLYVDGRLSEYAHVIETKSDIRIEPAHKSNFVGRQQELSDLVNLIKSNRCLNVWGAPGIGKSALVREFIERQQLDFKCCWSNISPEVSQENWIKETLILMGDRVSQDPREQLFETLFRKKWLLVIDNADRNDIYRDFVVSLSQGNCASKFIFISTRRLNELGAANLSSCYQVQGLKQYENLLMKLGLKKQSRWNELAAKYNNNPRELIHVAQIIEQFFNGSVSLYLENSSTLFSNASRDSMGQFKFSDVELKILTCVNQNSGIKSGELYEMLKSSLSSRQIIENLTGLEEKTFLEKTRNGLVVAPMIRKIIKSEEKVELC